jgi:hypothetical protein
MSSCDIVHADAQGEGISYEDVLCGVTDKNQRNQKSLSIRI